MNDDVAHGLTSESAIARLWHRVRQALSAHARTLTPTEHRLEGEVAALRDTLAERDREILALRAENDALASRLKIAHLEVEGLAEVIARDRKRVEAETARYARDIADATR
jgi:chromosome segregation ATPase